MNEDAPTHPPAHHGRHAARQAALWAVKILVSVGLLYFLLSRIDLAGSWQIAKTASIAWLGLALVLYLIMALIGSWRWRLLLTAQHVRITYRTVLASFLVATFFNNLLPSNIGGDVTRIRDTSKQAGSMTLAAMVVLIDRGIGLLGLMFVAALGTTITAQRSPTVGPVGPGLLWAALAGAVTVAGSAVMLPHGVGALLRPLRVLHQEWMEERINRLTGALSKFRETPRTLLSAFAGAILVQGILVLFYAAIAQGLHLGIPLAHLAIVVPLSFVILMVPVSIGGFGVREYTFVFYLTHLGLARESALALSLLSAALVMVFSLSGAVTYWARK